MWPSLVVMLRDVQAIVPCFVPIDDDALVIAWCKIKNVEPPTDIIDQHIARIDSGLDNVHRLFDTLNPHTADNVQPHIEGDGWANSLTAFDRHIVVSFVRSLDPAHLV